MFRKLLNTDELSNKNASREELLVEELKQEKKNIASRNQSNFYEISIESLLLNWVLKRNWDSLFESSMQEKSPSMQPINF